MQYYVRELPDGQAVLIAEDGYVLSTFDSVDNAVATCIIQCRVAPMWIEWYTSARIQVTDSDCIQHALAQHIRRPRQPSSPSAVANR